MQAQLRLAHIRAARAVVLPQRRLFATPPPPTGLPPSAPPPSGAAPVRPVVVTGAPVTPGSSTVVVPPTTTTPPPPPPPPPHPPRKPRSFFRRFLLYTTVGVLTFYPLSGWLSTRSETYRDIFTSTFPGGEWVADYADEKGWEQFGFGTVSQGAMKGWQKVTGEQPATSKDKVETTAKDAKAEAQRRAEQVKAEAEKRAAQLQKTAKEKAADAKQAVVKKAEETKAAVAKEASKAESEAASLKDRAIAATQEVADKAKALAADAKAKVAEATSNAPFNLSDGVEGVVREAEKALGKGEEKVEAAAKKVEEVITPRGGPRVLPDTQRPRELRPDTVTPVKPTHEGKELYAGPPLPLGFEPPPGYYLAGPPSAKKEPVEDSAEPAKPTLPLLVPKVKEFAEEPIISQLASTIDSLTASLSTPSTSPSPDASSILTKAHDDLTALNQRLADVKKAEKEKLEQSIARKSEEFEAVLRSREAEKAQSEAGLKEEWKQERQTMVDEWRRALENELEAQREGIEKRLHEEVVSQGIELQRRWLRSIKSQVETERGGRLAKLDHLTTSLKQLERITLDNSATLDDNVRLHKIWSALRAVQNKADAGDLAFDDELRALKAISIPAPGDDKTGGTVISATLSQLEQSGIAQSGVKSFAALSSWFSNSVAPRVQSASLVPEPEKASVVSHLASMGLSKLMFRPKAAIVEGSDVGAILARAEWCLGEKDLDGAAREVNQLTGWPGKLARDWLREARRTLEVRQALDVVATEATLASLLLV